MEYSDFLQTTKVIRMLYGRNKAEEFFRNNIKQYPSFFENIEIYKD